MSENPSPISIIQRLHELDLFFVTTRDWERDLRPLLPQYVDADVALRGIVPLQRLTIHE